MKTDDLRKIEKLYSRILDAKEDAETIQEQLDEIKDAYSENRTDFIPIKNSADHIDFVIKQLDNAANELLEIKSSH